MKRVQAHTDLGQAVARASHEFAGESSGVQQQSPAQLPTASTPAYDASPLHGLSISSARATLGAGRSLVTDYIMAADNTLAEIRVIDPTTHQVVAESPPDSIARMRQEMLAYQTLGSKTTNAS